MLEVFTKTDLNDYTKFVFSNRKAVLIYIIYIIIMSFGLTLYILGYINVLTMYATYGICAVSAAFMYRENKIVFLTEKEYQNVIKYILDEKGVTVEAGDFYKAKYDYNDIYVVEETTKHYAIYISIRHFYLIDKKQLDANQHKYFKTLFKENLPKNKYSLKKI